MNRRIGIAAILIISAIYAVYGSVSAQQQLDLKSVITGERSNDFLGTSLTADGDFNGDGILDLVISARDAGREKRGRVYIFYRTKFNLRLSASDADVIIEGEQPADRFGWRVESGTDLNGDGKSDLVVSSINVTDPERSAGRVYVFYGGDFPGSIDAQNADVIIQGETTEELFGWDIDISGDVNGDGAPDLVVSAVGAQKLGIFTGRVYVFHTVAQGKKILSVKDADQILDGEISNGHFGSSISTAGDISGDGIDDIIVGAYMSSMDMMNAGRGYVFYGSKNPPANRFASTADVIVQGTAARGWLGTDVLAVKDMDNDGHDEFLISATGKKKVGNESGEVYFLFGGKLKKQYINPEQSDFKFSGDRGFLKLGTALSTMDDIDGDKVPDILISGAGSRKPEGETRGKVIIIPSNILIGLLPNNTVQELRTERKGIQFGNALAAADLDGDNVAEIIVGAWHDHPPNAANTGRVYLYSWKNTVEEPIRKE